MSSVLSSVGVFVILLCETNSFAHSLSEILISLRLTTGMSKLYVGATENFCYIYIWEGDPRTDI